MNEKQLETKKEEAPNKGYSFIIGIFIALAIIILFAFLFPN
ncbi:hypothetical protein KDA_32950 [Dictyobacter alpinus]|uniref:Uncharacterized protein n=1 Tax=Dictyobacter alpinus TaxID=2014873 RepID=A0A402B8W0_9CHLR|nr:hypothetical protein [Dictyobacter alpinus]GCE27811.1 hypothetical protein KDA_32950 [Dictyobacter alpinus]